jgi:uncharacterized protein YndB with AHSA1/START domain
MAKTTNPEIVVTRLFDAPPETVFAAFTEKEHIEQWWLPKDGKTEELNVKPGGVWRYKQPGHGGMMFVYKVKFVEIDKPNRLVYDWGPDLENAQDVRTNVTFETEKDKTKVTLQLVFANEAEKQKAVKFGAIVGAMQSLEALAEHLGEPE